ncbi:MAG: MATE family efflux transporter [Clostridia bacterium]|nr:MATE family efflux transporter [Clostridia bacterium]
MNKLKFLIARLFRIKNIKWDGEAPEAKSLYIKALKIALPATIEGALLSLIGSVDSMMVGGISPEALTAVGLTNQPRMILLILTQALCVGTTALIARRKGEGDQEGANKVLMQSMFFVTIVGVLSLLLGFFGAHPLMYVAGAKEDTIHMSVEYFKIVSLSFVFNSWSLCLCAGMRAIGKTTITMVTNIAANLVNVALNYCLIGGKFGFPALGIRGAAIATAAGTSVSCIIAFAFAMKKGGYLRLSFKNFAFDKKTLSGFLRVGSSSIAESAALRIGFFINARLIADIGTYPFAGYQIVQQVTSLSFVLGDGVATAGATLVGQSLGSGRKDIASAYVQVSRKISHVASILLMILIFFTRHLLAGLFTKEGAIIAGAGIAFAVVITGIIPQNGRVVYSGCLRGAGDVKFVAMCALISVTVIRPLLTFICCYPMDKLLPGWYFAYTGPWIAFVIDAYIRQYLLSDRIKKGAFLNVKL